MSDRVALTTGANSGLGLATALEMAQRGYRSVGTVRSKGKAELVHRAAREAGVTVETHLLDVTDAERCAEVIEVVKPDVLVNNAGYMLYAAIEEVDDAEATAILDTMVVAPMRLARLSLPTMRERGWGRIIQISSLSARVSVPLMGWYQACKQALEGASDALRLEVASDGIHVVLIEPGIFRSELSDEFSDLDRSPDSRFAKAYEASRDSFRLIQPFVTDTETVARAVARAADTRWPQARYPVGLDARITTLTQPLVHPAVRDYFLRRANRL